MIGACCAVSEKVAIMLDGGFVKKRLAKRLKRFPGVADVVGLCGNLMTATRLAGKDLFRIYYYDAPPLDGHSANPIDKTVINFSVTTQATQNRALIDSLEMEPDFAVRRGSLMHTGWKLGRSALKTLAKTPRPIAGTDLVPDITQKGVDIRIGLDIAWIALKRVVDVLVLVTGDSDFIPVMKFARKEGLRVYLDPLSAPVRRDLKAHADFVF